MRVNDLLIAISRMITTPKIAVFVGSDPDMEMYKNKPTGNHGINAVVYPSSIYPKNTDSGGRINILNFNVRLYCNVKIDDYGKAAIQSIFDETREMINDDLLSEYPSGHKYPISSKSVGSVSKAVGGEDADVLYWLVDFGYSIGNEEDEGT